MTPQGARAVFLTKQVPYPADSGGRLRSAALVEQFRRHFAEVHVLGFGAPPPAGLVPPGVRVHAVPAAAPLAGSLRARSAAMGRWYSPRLRDLVGKLTDDATHLHADFVQMLVNLPDPRRLDSLDMHNVESDLLALRAAADPRWAARLLLRRESARLRAWERRAAADAVVTCCAEPDRRRLDALGIRVDAVVPNGATIPPSAPPPAAAPVLLFVGALDWRPNSDGVRWFVREVWPRVREHRPDATFVIVGRSPGPEVTSLAGDGIEVLADVPEVSSSYARAAVAVCPLLTGGGSRLKIVEALAHARPVVSTTLGAEGMERLVGSGVVLADEPAAFAAAVEVLLGDPAAARQAGRTGREQALAGWSWEATLAPMARVLQAWLEAHDRVPAAVDGVAGRA